MRYSASVAALVILATSPAFAYPTDVPDVAYVSSLDTGGEAYVTTPPLTTGQDYLLEAYGLGVAEVINPQGQATVVLHLNHQTAVRGFRSAYSAAFQLKVIPELPDYVSARLHPDCRGDTKTNCWLDPKSSRTSIILDTADRDWYKVAMRKGARYRLTLKSPVEQVWLTLRSPSGKLLVRHVTPSGGGSAIVDYRAPTSGTYYAAISLASSWGANEHVLSTQQR